MDLDNYKLRASFHGIGRVRMLVAMLIGLVLLNPPIIQIFSQHQGLLLFGWPVLLVFIFAVWLLLILLVIWPRPASKYDGRQADGAGGQSKP